MTEQSARRMDPARASAQLSVTDMFRIGLGPSSSHTMGPMRAAAVFARDLVNAGHQPHRIRCELYGSLGATGRGHGTDRAVVWGLTGHAPETADHVELELELAEIAATGTLQLAGRHPLPFRIERDITFLPRQTRPEHVNTLRLVAEDDRGRVLSDRLFCSVGGGFVTETTSGIPRPLAATAATNPEPPDGTTATAASHLQPPNRQTATPPEPHPFTTGAELLAECERAGMSIAQMVRANEEAWRSPSDLDAALDAIWEAMRACVAAGVEGEGTLPGPLQVPKRAGMIHDALKKREVEGGERGEFFGDAPRPGESGDPLLVMDWLNLYALAVNEENASGHRVVTAPTNGAAGVIPAVISYYVRFLGGSASGVRDFLLTATAIGTIVKLNASIAGAEVGCQGEVGSASAMAAAGLAQVMGGTPAQVENAAEIAMEHNLGLTCDPIGGLVQIPCIERNAVGAVKSVNAARLAMWGDGQHTVSLDAVVETMRQTGADMMSKYKETSEGGLAVNVIEC